MREIEADSFFSSSTTFSFSVIPSSLIMLYLLLLKINQDVGNKIPEALTFLNAGGRKNWGGDRFQEQRS